MIQQGLIRPSISLFSSPVLLVKKDNSTWTTGIKSCHRKRPFFNPDHKFMDKLHRACIFSKIDLKAGYHHIQVPDCGIEKTAFRNNEGYYKFTTMSFGHTNVPTTFQATMNLIF